jgi:nucleotide-binding universal stress UspA family protein
MGNATNHIVVGVDGSAASWDALHWAVNEAYRWRSPLDLVTVDHNRAEAATRKNESRLAQMVTEARRLEPSVRVTGTVARGDVVTELRRAADDSRMVVVGHRDHGTFHRLRVGSTSRQVAEGATVPVTVVYGDGSGRDRIVVGVDGSAGSEIALAVALEEARTRGCPVVAAFAYSRNARSWLPDRQPLPSDPQLLHASAYAALESTVAPWRDKYPGIDVTLTVSAMSAVGLLAGLSRDARFLVVGAHGDGHPAGLLGRVPERLLHRTHCPTLIAR